MLRAVLSTCSHVLEAYQGNFVGVQHDDSGHTRLEVPKSLSMQKSLQIDGNQYYSTIVNQPPNSAVAHSSPRSHVIIALGL